MRLSRRAMFASLATMAAGAVADAAQAGAGVAAAAPVALPDRTGFNLDHVFLNAAYAHPMSGAAYRAADAFLLSRMEQPDRAWPVDNARDQAVAAFAGLINADPGEIAIVPSTLEGENLLVAALGLDERAGAVTDAYHYSLPFYGELRKRGVPVTIVAPRNNRIELADLDRAIGATTRLVAVSAVSSDTGFQHDLKAVCDIAHAKGALVYADIIQAVGATPIDVKASGVDFCCAGTYKWLMGDFGAAFLYVRPDRLKELRRVQVGWRQYASYASHIYPFDPPGPVGVEWTLGTDTASRLEVSTPSWAALAAVAASIGYVQQIGVDRIERHRAPMMRRLRDELPAMGFQPLTNPESTGPICVFSCRDAERRLGPALKAARIKVSLYKNRIRISPSVYNDMADIDHLLRVVAATA